MTTSTFTLLTLALGIPAISASSLASTDLAEFRSEKIGSSTGSDQVEFMGPSSDNEGSTALGRTERFDELEKKEDEVTTYRNTYDKDKGVVNQDETPEIYTQDESRSTSTDTSTNRSKAGQTDDEL